MVSVQMQVFRDVCGGKCNTTCVVPKWGLCQARATKSMGRLPHAHWYIHILHTVIYLMRSGNKTLEIHLVKASSTRDTIAKGLYGNNAEPMEFIGTKVTGMIKERSFIRTYFSNTRPLYKVLHQDIMVQGCNGVCSYGIICIIGSKKVRGAIKLRWKVWILQVPARDVSTTKFFHLFINGVTPGKFKT